MPEMSHEVFGKSSLGRQPDRHGWEKLPPVNAGAVACRNCGCGAHSDLEMDRVIAVGFGSAGYSRDGETLWSEDHAMDESEYPTVAHVEELAKADPDHEIGRAHV